MDILTEVLKVGGPTTAISIIFYLIIKDFIKLVSNHMNHNTEALKEVSEIMKQDIEATKETKQVLQGLKETLLKINGNRHL